MDASETGVENCFLLSFDNGNDCKLLGIWHEASDAYIQLTGIKDYLISKGGKVYKERLRKPDDNILVWIIIDMPDRVLSLHIEKVTMDILLSGTVCIY